MRVVFSRFVSADRYRYGCRPSVRPSVVVCNECIVV